MEEGSENTEQVIGDEDIDPVVDIEQVFGIGGVDLENDSGMLRIDCRELENESRQVLGVEGNDFDDDDNRQPIEFDGRDLGESDQVFEFESNDRGNDSDHIIEIVNNDHLNGVDGDMLTVGDQNDGNQGRRYAPPVVGMEFKSYDDAYNYYNCYAKDLGFAIRVKSSWTKRNSKEKRGAVLCCNCEGFKTLNEASSRRKETRTGCLAMLRLRLVECDRWRVDEVRLQHNHLFDPERAQNSKSQKKIDAGTKRKLDQAIDVEVRTIKLYRTPATDAVGYGSSNERELGEHVSQARLKLGNADAQVLYSYFTRAQLINPNFFYVMDFNDEGFVRNVFWIDSRSRAAYMYFSDVVAVDTTCLLNKYEIPLVAFLGFNHHGHSILLGCGLLGDESLETYIWLYRTWLTCMLGRPPQTIITYQCRALQSATAEVFPRAHHRLCLPVVIQSVLQNVGELGESVVFQTVLHRAVYNSIKVDEFEMAWDDMIKSFGISDIEFLHALYGERERWAPVYFKDTLFAGIPISQPGKFFTFFPDDNAHGQTSLKDFFDIYDSILQKSFKKEALADYESKLFTPLLKTKSSYELQLSEIYTKEICLKFQDEVEMMSNCISATQANANGPYITFMVKERDADGITRDVKNFEVMYDKIGQDVRCICSCFNFNGFLCRHALSVLSYNDILEVPGQYVLQRWRKDVERLYEPDLGSNYMNISNPVQWFDHLHRCVTQVVEEGISSEDHYMGAWQALKESLNKVRLVEKEAC